MKKLMVGVVFGGRSVEHDVSIVTAHQVMAALEARHDVVPIYVSKDGEFWTGSALNDLEVYRSGKWSEVGQRCYWGPGEVGGILLQPVKRLRSVELPIVALDAVVPAIHGTFGEDGTLQGLLELAGLPYTGSGVAASAVGMDKAIMKSVFRAHGLPVVPDVLVEVEQLDSATDAVLDSVEREIGYPCFVKPVKAGSSVGIAKATDRDGLRDALDVARNYDRRILVERSMEGCIEVNCSVIGGTGREGGRGAKVSVCERPIAWQEFLSFEDKYLRGGKDETAGTKSGAGMASAQRQIPAELPEAITKQVQENALAAFRAIDASGVARIDSFVDEQTGETWVMEINTVPGSFSFYLWEATGIAFEDLMDELLDIALTTHRAKQELMFTFDSTLLEQKPGGKTGG